MFENPHVLEHSTDVPGVATSPPSPRRPLVPLPSPFEFLCCVKPLARSLIPLRTGPVSDAHCCPLSSAKLLSSKTVFPLRRAVLPTFGCAPPSLTARPFRRFAVGIPGTCDMRGLFFFVPSPRYVPFFLPLPIGPAEDSPRSTRPYSLSGYITPSLGVQLSLPFAARMSQPFTLPPRAVAAHLALSRLADRVPRVCGITGMFFLSSARPMFFIFIFFPAGHTTTLPSPRLALLSPSIVLLPLFFAVLPPSPLSVPQPSSRHRPPTSSVYNLDARPVVSGMFFFLLSTRAPYVFFFFPAGRTTHPSPTPWLTLPPHLNRATSLFLAALLFCLRRRPIRYAPAHLVSLWLRSS